MTTRTVDPHALMQLNAIGEAAEAICRHAGIGNVADIVKRAFPVQEHQCLSRLMLTARAGEARARMDWGSKGSSVNSPLGACVLALGIVHTAATLVAVYHAPHAVAPLEPLAALMRMLAADMAQWKPEQDTSTTSGGEAPGESPQQSLVQGRVLMEQLAKAAEEAGIAAFTNGSESV